MPPRRQHGIEGQAAFPGLQVTMPDAGGGKGQKWRPSLSSALSPEFVKLDPLRYEDLSDQQLDMVAAEQLQPALINVSRGSRGAIGYRYGERRFRRIAVPPVEFKILAGSIENLGEGAATGSYANRQDDEVADRAGFHAVTNALGRLRNLESHHDGQKKLASKFQLAANDKNLGRALFGYKANMERQLTTLREIVFGEMLLAAGLHNRWSKGDLVVARRALDKLLFINRSNNSHISNFRKLIWLAVSWDGYRLEATQAKIAQGEAYLAEHPIE